MEPRHELTQYWLEKSAESFHAAQVSFDSGLYSASVNRLYYAAFYAISAVLALEGIKYGKHSAVQSAVHRDLVRPGLLSMDQGRFYDRLMGARHEGDYGAFVVFEKEQVQAMLERTEVFLTEVRQLALRSLPKEP